MRKGKIVRINHVEPSYYGYKYLYTIEFEDKQCEHHYSDTPLEKGDMVEIKGNNWLKIMGITE